MDTYLDDHSRVVLSQQNTITGSDYINASHIDVSFCVSFYVKYVKSVISTVHGYQNIIHYT